MSTLYIVATPIGNLEDITLRALRILREVDLVLAEDTRVTRKLFQHYKIDTPIESFHFHSTEGKMERIISLLEDNKQIALVSDAGTPSISDPGSYLVSKVREILPEVKIIPIPGASSLITALSVSGLKTDNFTFLGFLPHKKGRNTIINNILNSETTVCFFESPHRILKTLLALKDSLDQNRRVLVFRELTKIFEESKIGSASEIYDYYFSNKDKVRGEFVILVEGK